MTDILLVFIWVQIVCKRLLADDKILSLHAKSYNRCNILSHIGSLHVYVYHKNSDTLNTLRHAMLFKQSKSNIQRIKLESVLLPMLNGTLSFLQKYLFLLLSFQFCIIYVNVVKNVQVTSKLSP